MTTSPSKNYEASVQLILSAASTATPHHEVILSLGPTPQYLVDHGFPELDLVINAKTIDKAHFDHGISKNLLMRLQVVISNPKALYRSATMPGASVVITLETRNGSPILVPIHANKQIGRSRKANVVASVYNKEASIEARWQQQGLLLWQK